MLLDTKGKMIISDSGKRVIPFDNPLLAEMARDADVLFGIMHLTVVCMHCGGTPAMANHKSDPDWKMECACTVRKLVNVTPPRERAALAGVQ